MKLPEFFRPAWNSKNEARAAAAVQRINDADLLFRVATTARTDTARQLAAVRLILAGRTDPLFDDWRRRLLITRSPNPMGGEHQTWFSPRGVPDRRWSDAASCYHECLCSPLRETLKSGIPTNLPLLLPFLLSALQHSDPTPRIEAIDILSAWQVRDAVPSIQPLLSAVEPNVRTHAAAALQELQGLPAQIYIHWLGAPGQPAGHGTDRRIAAMGIATATDPSLLSVLFDELLNHRLGSLVDQMNQDTVRERYYDQLFVIRCLAKGVSSIAAANHLSEPLLKLLSLPFISAKWEAVTTLLRHPDPAACAGLCEILDRPHFGCDPRLEDTHALGSKLICETAAALGRCGSPNGVPTLIRALRHEDKDVRKAVATALGQLHDDRVYPALAALLPVEREDSVFAAAVAALNSSGPPELGACFSRIFRERDVMPENQDSKLLALAHSLLERDIELPVSWLLSVGIEEFPRQVVSLLSLHLERNPGLFCKDALHAITALPNLVDRRVTYDDRLDTVEVAAVDTTGLR